MKSIYEKMFDSLESDEQQICDRIDRIMQSGADAVPEKRTERKQERKTPSRWFSTRRGVAALAASFILILAVSVAVPVGIWYSENMGMYGTLNLLKETYVDMTDVAAFGVWQADSGESLKTTANPKISNVSYIKASNSTEEEEEDDGWDDELYDWESDYDWDPDKANVLIAIDEDGKIEEVVYERTNGRGQVRQSKLGNAAKVFVAEGFTFVLYVDDSTWDFWEDVNFAQEMLSPQGFGCNHEQEQTIVIHNATGKVYAFKDIIPMISDMVGTKQYTIGLLPFYDDVISIHPLYGNYDTLWFKVRYDESLDNIVYDPIEKNGINVQSVRKDMYGNYYILNGMYKEYISEYDHPASVRLDEKIGDTVYFTEENSLFYGVDRRVYAFSDNRLMVFDSNLELQPVDIDTETAFEGITDSFYPHYYNFDNDGECYVLRNGYLFSMYGEVWKLGEEGELTRLEDIIGRFPRIAFDCYLLEGEMIAFVDAKPIYEHYSEKGVVVHIDFSTYSENNPVAKITDIIKAGRISCNRKRLIAEQTETPFIAERVDSKYFSVTVENGKPTVEFVAYYDQYDTLSIGGRLKLVKPITEPLRQY